MIRRQKRTDRYALMLKSRACQAVAAWQAFLVRITSFLTVPAHPPCRLSDGYRSFKAQFLDQGAVHAPSPQCRHYKTKLPIETYASETAVDLIVDAGFLHQSHQLALSLGQALWQQSLQRPDRLDRARIPVRHGHGLDRDVPRIFYLAQGLHDRAKVNVPRAGIPAVRVGKVDVKKA